MMRKLKAVLIMAIAIIFLSSCAHMSPANQEMTTSGHLARIMQKGEFVVGTTGNMPP